MRTKTVVNRPYRLSVLALRAALPALLGMCAALAPAAHARGFDAQSFATFVDMRVGTGQPIYWYCTGTVYEYPSGKPLMRMEGIDTARRWRDPAAPQIVQQLSRKTFFYRDLLTDAVLTSINGAPLAPIEYPYQYITYELRDGAVQTFVEQGRAPRLQRIGPGNDMQVRMVRGDYIFTAPLFLDFPAGNDARYQAFENYDFIVSGKPDVDPATHRLSWLRYGDIPGVGKTVMHLVAWRIDRYADLPGPMRDYLETKARLWMQPPADFAEIRSLQQALDPQPAAATPN
ncbi:MAG TPA: hypothetical protein PK159_05280 [Steroidobacteraceae bacterium]|nr:hypothetical protein [Steroidobacteraceae bacterium]